MSDLIVYPAQALQGVVELPGDKSISHRALLLGAVADGPGYLFNLNPGNDCRATLDCLRQLGVKIEIEEERTIVWGRGLGGLCPPLRPLDCRNSATTMRLLAGLLAGQPFDAILTGSEQLMRRPMDRIMAPLRAMGAGVTSPDGLYPPLRVYGRPLHGLDYRLPVASAQVKSALLLAGLFADGPITLHEPAPARDHTERLLRAMAADLVCEGLSLRLMPPTRLAPVGTPDHPWRIPGDLSAAAFLLVAGCLVPHSQIRVRNVGLNPTRTGLLDALQAMGAQVKITEKAGPEIEPDGDLEIETARLCGTTVRDLLTLRLVDEVPILAVAATQAQGQTTITQAGELRFKESDRLHALATGLTRMGAQLQELPDGLVIVGPTPLHGAVVDSHGDHRLAMALAVAGLVAQGQTLIRNAACISDSFPSFPDTLNCLGAGLVHV